MPPEGQKIQLYTEILTTHVVSVNVPNLKVRVIGK